MVDHELRVHRLSGLRVADASIMPTVVSGNTNAACIMIGREIRGPDKGGLAIGRFGSLGPAG